MQGPGGYYNDKGKRNASILRGVRIMMTFLFSLFSLIAAAVSFAGYKTIFKIEENDEDVADVVSAKVASHKHDANNGMAASH